jgi:hypothetical protein
MRHPRALAPIWHKPGKAIGDSEPPLGLAQQKHPSVRRQATAVESGFDLLASDGWKRERQEAIVVHGGCVWSVMPQGLGFDARILSHINRLSYTRHPLFQAILNKAG